MPKTTENKMYIPYTGHKSNEVRKHGLFVTKKNFVAIHLNVDDLKDIWNFQEKRVSWQITCLNKSVDNESLLESFQKNGQFLNRMFCLFCLKTRKKFMLTAQHF